MTQPSPQQPVNLFEYEALAQERLSQMAYDYYASGSGDEITLGLNRTALDRIRLIPRVLIDISQRDASTTVLGTPVTTPILIAPTAFHKLAHPDGEAATARAAAEADIIMTLSTLSNTNLEDVAAAADGPRWFQLYIHRDRDLTRSLVERAENAGYRALCITVDAPLLGRRERDVRNRFALPPDLSLANVEEHLRALLPSGAPDSALAGYAAQLFDQTINWDDIGWLKSITSLPIVLKGIHHPDDARLAVEHGVQAIIVSNHGARQLDSVPATIDMLPPIADAVGGDIEILLDGGIRRGTDIVKALALGARAVLLGRPILWGLAVDGQAGVAHVLRLLTAEFDLAMALLGVTSVAGFSRRLLWDGPA